MLPYNNSMAMTGTDAVLRYVKIALLDLPPVVCVADLPAVEAATWEHVVVVEVLEAVVATVVDIAAVVVAAAAATVVLHKATSAEALAPQVRTSSPITPRLEGNVDQRSTSGMYALNPQLNTFFLKLTPSQLPWSTSNEDLVELFQTIGKVERAEIQYEPNGRSRGTGVVQLENADLAETAICKFPFSPFLFRHTSNILHPI